MLRQVKKLLAFILALALVFTTFTSDYASAKVFAEGDTTEEQGEPEEEQDDSEDESDDEEDSEEEDEEESEDESEDEESEDEEESEEASDEEIPEEEIPEEIPEEEEESEEDEEGRIVITYVVDGEGGSVSNAKDSFDPESEEEITIEGSTAEAEVGFKFAGWTGGYLEEALMHETFVPDYTMITEDATFTASFEAIEEPEEEKLGPVKDSTVVNGIKISLHAEEGILPADAKLVVKTLEDSDEVSISEEDVKEAVDAATEESVTATYSFDINIYSEEAGGYVQPEDGSVTITFDVESSEINSAIADADTDVSVYYIAEDGGDIEGVDKVADVSDKVEFKTDHFSVYTVVLKNGAVEGDNTQGFVIKFRDYENHNTKLIAEGGSEKKYNIEIGDGIVTAAEIAKNLDVESITYNKSQYIFAEAVDYSSDSRKIEYFYVDKAANSNKYVTYYKAVGSEQKYLVGTNDIRFYYIKSIKSSNQMTIAIRNDGNAPSEPWIYDGRYYTFIADGENGGFDTGDISKYISIKDVSQTEITTVSTSPYDSRSYKVYAIAGIESVNGYLTQKFIDYANQKAKDHGKLHDGEYIDWYVIKYQTNDNVWHIDGVVRKSSKLTLSYDKNIPEGSSYSGHWPTGRQYDVNQWTKKATATVEGKNAVEKDGKEFISRDGYTFLGWNTDKNATVATYQEGNTIEFAEDTTLYAIWQRNTVNVKLTYKYADGKTGDTVVNSLKSYDVENIIADPTRDGYDFAGWKSDIAGDANTYGIKEPGWKKQITMPENDVVLTAQWTPKSVNYIVRWLEKTDDGDVDIKTADTSRTAKTGSTAEAKEADKHITGYDYDGDNSTPSVVVTANGKAEIKLYFKVHTHSIKYELTNDSAKPAGYDLPAQVSGIKYGSTNNVEDVPVIEGYTFTGWTAPRGVTVNDKGEFSMPDADVTFTGKFTAQNHKYTVYWWEKDGEQTIALPNPNLQNFTSEERWELTGKTVYANSDADTKIAGYTLDTSSATSTVVKGDDSARIDLYFTKNSYTVTFVYENAAPNGTTPMTAPAPKSFKFNAIVDPYAEDVAKVTAPDGYTFDGWRYEKTTTPVGTFSMPSDNVTLYGKFTANSGIKYVVEYYFEKVNSTDATNLNNYDIDNNQTITDDGTTGTSVTGYKKTFEGFKEDPTIKYVSRKNNKDTDVATGDKILGDGSLVIKLYYPRESYTVSYEYDKDYSAINANPTAEELAQYTRQYKYGEIVEVKEYASALGYNFGGWKYSTWEELNELTDPDSGNVFAKLAKALLGRADHTYFEMPAGDVKLIGAFEAKTDTIYTVAHYLETSETGKYELGTVEQIGGDIEKNPEEKQGATGSKVTDYVREIENYKHNTNVKADEFFDGNKVAQEDATILADGSLLINVYYQHSDDLVEFYVLLPGRQIPADGGPRDPVDYYPYKSGAAAVNWLGTAKLPEGAKWPVYDTNPDRSANVVNNLIISRPTSVINSDSVLQEKYPGVTENDIVWYVYKHEGSVSHIDGYIKDQSITVVYNKNDGTETPATYNDDEAKTGNYTVLGEENTSVKELMTREGHTFEGWSLNPKATPGSADVIQPGSPIMVMTTGTVLYAVWSVNEYTVKYEYDKVPTGVTLPELPDKGLEVAHAFDAEVTVADPVKAPEGYYFTGWKAPETVTVTDGKFKMPAENIIIKGSFAEKLKVRIALAAPGENTERLYNGQVQTPNTQIKFVVEGGDDPELAAYIQDTLNNAGDDVLGAFNTIRDMFVITAYAYDESLDLTPVADDEIPEGYEITGYTVVGEGGIDANKDRPGTADADKKLVGREKDYPIVFNGSDMIIKKDGFDLRDVADITVVDADGNEVTDLSSGITIGYLTIIPREVTLTSGSASRVENGTPLTSPAVAISGDGFVAAVKDGETGDEIEVDKLKAEGAIGTITTPGSVENKIDEIGKFKTGFFRKDTNYVIKEVIGTLTITSGGGGGDDTSGTPTTIPDAPVATAPAPAGAVLGAQRDVPVDGPAVLGARRAGTDDTTSRTARAFVVLVSAAVALSLLISGKKKREN